MLAAMLAGLTWRVANAACWASNPNGNRKCAYFVDKAGLKIQLCEDQPGDCEKIGYQKQLPNGEQHAPNRGRTRLKNSHASSSEARGSLSTVSPNASPPSSSQNADAGGQSDTSLWPVFLVVLVVVSGFVGLSWKFGNKKRSQRQTIYSQAEKIAAGRLTDTSTSEESSNSESHPPATSEAPEFHAVVAEINKEPFQQMLAALLDGDGERFSSCAERIFSNRLYDAQEYLARALDAGFQAGLLGHSVLLAQEMMLRERYGDYQEDRVNTWRRLFPDRDPNELNEYYTSLENATLSGVLAFEHALNNIQEFLTYRTFPSFIFANEEGKACAPGRPERVAELNDNLMTQTAAVDTKRTQRMESVHRAAQLPPDWALVGKMLLCESEYLQELDQWLDEAVMTNTGVLWAILSSGDIETLFSRVASACCLATGNCCLATNGAHSVFRLDAKERVLRLAQLAMSHIPPDSPNYSDAATALRNASIPMPTFKPAEDSATCIKCTLEGEVTISTAAVATSPTSGRSSGVVAELGPTGKNNERGSATEALTKEETIRALEDLEGLEGVKRSVKEVENLLAMNAERKKNGLPVSQTSLHVVFAGNPGTGKTTVARIYANILRSYGFLTSGQLIEVSRAELVAEYQGQTAVKTRKVLERSLGGLLLVDEAYSLRQNDRDGYGAECLETLLKFMEDHREEFVVVMAGYKDRMDALLESNPGLKSRFPQYFLFEDYSNEQLASILLKMATEQGYVIRGAALEAATESLSRERAEKDFSNARAARNLLERAIRRQAVRLGERRKGETALTIAELKRLVRNDVVGEESALRKTGEQALDELIGLANIKEAIREYRDLIQAAKARGRDPREALQPYFVILGNPGTGKTTVARVLGKIFSEAGYLPSDKVVEVDRSQLVAGFIGQTAIKTREVLERALGGTLFIDEAHSLVVHHTTNEDFGRESIETLLKFMEDNRGRLVVVAAGYEKKMQDFLASNPGLRSRFTNVLRLPDYTAEESALIFSRMAGEQGLKIDRGLNAKLPKLLADLIAAPDWSNGRDVRTLLEFSLRAQGRRLARGESEQTNVLTLADISSGLEAMLQNKRAAGGNGKED
jgi:SpoVK/Ycf46/Vps4 family AAA+-type ATPase